MKRLSFLQVCLYIYPPTYLPTFFFLKGIDDKIKVKKATEILSKNLDITLDAPQLTLLSIPDNGSDGDVVFNLVTNDSQGSVRVILCKGSKCITDVTPMAKLLPSSTSGDRHAAYHGKDGFRFLHLEQQRHMQNYDHVGVWQHGKNNPQTFIVAKLGQESTTNIVIDKSNWDLFTKGGVSFDITGSQLYMAVQFPKLRNPLLTYKLTLQWTKGLNDRQEVQEDVFAPIVQQNMGGESKYHVGLDGNNISIDINFHASGERDNDDKRKFLQLQFWKLPGNIHGSARLQIDWYGSLGKCVLRYGPSVVMFTFIMALDVVANGSVSVIVFFCFGILLVYTCVYGRIEEPISLNYLHRKYGLYKATYWPCNNDKHI